MKNMVNKTFISGYLYQHDLQEKVTGENSKNPGTKYITGKIDIATDDAMTNVVSVHYTYVTEKTSTGKVNTSYGLLGKIINGELCNVMEHGKDKAVKLRVDSAIGLNEFYSDRNGTSELVSVKRNEGGFIHVENTLNTDEKTRSTFEVDMIITGVKRTDADEEKGIEERLTLKGATFNFRKALLPIELTVTNPMAMDYFEGLEPSSKEPVFTKLKGQQISTTVVKRIEEEGAFGEVSVRETTSSRKDFVVTWAMKEPYDWDAENTITVLELQNAMKEREIYLASIKQRAEEYKNSKTNAIPSAGAIKPKLGNFDF